MTSQIESYPDLYSYLVKQYSTLEKAAAHDAAIDEKYKETQEMLLNILKVLGEKTAVTDALKGRLKDWSASFQPNEALLDLEKIFTFMSEVKKMGDLSQALKASQVAAEEARALEAAAVELEATINGLMDVCDQLEGYVKLKESGLRDCPK